MCLLLYAKVTSLFVQGQPSQRGRLLSSKSVSKQTSSHKSLAGTRTFLKRLWHLLRSRFLFQGVALNAMLEFFRCLVAAKVPGLGQKDLLALLVNPVLQQQGATIHKQVPEVPGSNPGHEHF